MLCSACPVNPSALPSPELGGGGEGVSVESGRSRPPVPLAGCEAGADPGYALAGTDQARSSVWTAVGPAPFSTWVALEDGSSLLGLRAGARWRGDGALRPGGCPGNLRRVQRGCPYMRVWQVIGEEKGFHWRLPRR